MGFIPESAPRHNDLIDIMIEASQNVKDIQDANGVYHQELQLDPEVLWWKTHIVNSPVFARFAVQLKRFEQLAQQVYSHMSQERANEYSRQIIAEGLNFRRSIDAKSSESLRNAQNTQSNLIDKINRNKVERAITLKGDAKNTFLGGMMGQKAQEESMQD